MSSFLSKRWQAGGLFWALLCHVLLPLLTLAQGVGAAAVPHGSGAWQEVCTGMGSVWIRADAHGTQIERRMHAPPTQHGAGAAHCPACTTHLGGGLPLPVAPLIPDALVSSIPPPAGALCMAPLSLSWPPHSARAPPADASRS